MSSSTQPKAVLFDLLTALLDSWTLWDEAAGSSEAGRKWRAKYLDITFGCGAYKPYPDLVRRAAEESGLGSGPADRLIEQWDHLKPWLEVHDALEKLKSKGYKLGVVTNCSKELGRRAADCVGVKFDMVITAEEIGYYKPAREAYLKAADAMGFSVDEILFVAGSSGDVVGAAKAGLRVVWHNHVGLAAKPGSAPLRESRSLDDALKDYI